MAPRAASGRPSNRAISRSADRVDRFPAGAQADGGYSLALRRARARRLRSDRRARTRGQCARAARDAMVRTYVRTRRKRGAARRRSQWARPGARARAEAVSGPLDGIGIAAHRPGRVESWTVSVLRMGARLRRHHTERRPAPDLRTLHRAVELPAPRVPVLRERRPRSDHVLRDT